MADARRIHPSYRGSIYYNPAQKAKTTDPFRGRRQRPHVLRIACAHDEFITRAKQDEERKRAARRSSEQAWRLIRFVSPFKSSARTKLVPAPLQEEEASPQPRCAAIQAPPTTGPGSSPVNILLDDNDNDNMRMAAVSPRGSVSAGLGAAAATRPPLTESTRNNSTASTSSTVSTASTVTTSSTSAPSMGSGVDGNALPGQKPVAVGNGVSVFVTTAEPVIYLSGFENQDPSTRSTAMLRGNMLLRVTKTAKIKTVSLKFRGKAETDWPEGIPPKRSEYKDTYNIIDHSFTFYDCNMGSSEHHGAHTFVPAKGPGAAVEPETRVIPTFDQFRKSGVFESITSSTKERRLSLQSNHSNSFGKGEVLPNPAHKGYRTFTPGDYFYPFELPIDSRYPESINVELGYVKYELEAVVERAGAFRANLVGSREIQLIRAPSGESLEAVEPIAISRDWEDQLHYEIVISGKSFPIGAQVPIAFKLTPLAKVQCHRIKVFITENIQYFTKDKKVHRMEPTRKLQLFEKRADSPSNSTFEGSNIRIISGGGIAYDDRDRAASGDESVRRDATNLLGGLDDEYNIGPTEMELNVQLPGCHNMPEKDKNQRIHFDTTYANIQVNHWIKIVMRLSKADPENPGKRRHFEISIDSPLNILSCLAAQTNISLPSYTSSDAGLTSIDHSACGCPGAPQRRQTSPSLRAIGRRTSITPPQSGSPELQAGLTPPPAAHVAGSAPIISPASASSSPTAESPPNGVPYDAARDRNRPMHLLRQPSFNPPSFDESEPPPPLVTPPPHYESLVGPGDDPDRGLADYFQRLADEIDESDDGARWARRLEIPLTPGGRVNRSMDEMRAWHSPSN